MNTHHRQAVDLLLRVQKSSEETGHPRDLLGEAHVLALLALVQAVSELPG